MNSFFVLFLRNSFWIEIHLSVSSQHDSSGQKHLSLYYGALLGPLPGVGEKIGFDKSNSLRLLLELL